MKLASAALASTAVAAAGIAGVSALDADAVAVELYFEAFCPGCHEFITQDLAAALKDDEIANIMNVTLVPYGNARTSGSTVSCQHGEDECKGNTWELCGIDQAGGAFSAYWPYLQCMETEFTDMLSNTQKCAKAGKLDYSSLSSCANGSKGKQLLIDAGKRTGSHMYVPWVQINGAHSSSAEDNLINAVCKAYKGNNKPKACDNQGQLGARRHHRCPVGPVEVKLQDRFTVTAGTHYGDPKNGCLSDEQAVQIQGVTGDFCTPPCKSMSCPSDVPSGVTATPTCALQTTTGTKYCALLCNPSGNGDECGSEASCKSISGVGICTYDD